VAPGRAVAQLAALRSVHELFAAEGIEYWLFGGWAVDFYAARITRDHEDVDVAVWRDDQDLIDDVLRRDRWTHAPADGEDGGTGYERDSVRLELTFLARDDAEVYIPLRGGRIPWAADSFGPDVAELDGVRARLITLAALRRGKASAREDPADGAKDRADARTLAGIGAPPE
jgi:hypothetical protein